MTTNTAAAALAAEALRTLRMVTPRWGYCPYLDGPLDVPGWGDLDRIGLVYAEQRPSATFPRGRWYWTRSDAGNRFLECVDGITRDHAAPVPPAAPKPAGARPASVPPLAFGHPLTTSFDAFMRALRATPPDWTQVERDPHTIVGWSGLEALGLVEGFCPRFAEFWQWRRTTDGARLLAAIDAAFAEPRPEVRPAPAYTPREHAERNVLDTALGDGRISRAEHATMSRLLARPRGAVLGAAE